MTLEQLTLRLTGANRSGSYFSATINDDMCKEN